MLPTSGTPVRGGPGGLQPTQDDKNLAMIVHFGNIVAGIVLPLIVYLVKRDQSQFVAFHALQTLYLGLVVTAVSIVTCGFGAILAVPAMVVLNVLAGIKVNAGEEYEYPLVAKWARKSVYGG